MKLRFKEDPKEWRKHAWLTALGVALICTVLRWRHVLSNRGWQVALAAAAVVFLSAWIHPRIYRPYYRASTWLGFYMSMVGGRVALAMFFVLVLSPMGLLMRLMGKDSLHLKKQEKVNSYWNKRGEKRRLDRLF